VSSGTMRLGGRVDVSVPWRGGVVVKKGGWPSERSPVGSPSNFQGSKERLRRVGKSGGCCGDGGEGGRRGRGEEWRRWSGMALHLKDGAKGVAAVDGAWGRVARHVA
jgi:hypothetical protein